MKPFQKLSEKLFPQSGVMVSAFFEVKKSNCVQAAQQSKPVLRLSRAQMAEIFPTETVMVSAIFTPAPDPAPAAPPAPPTDPVPDDGVRRSINEHQRSFPIV